MTVQLGTMGIVVRARCMYKCDKCGAVEVGATATIELQDVAAHELEATLLQFNPGNNHMPVGWSGYGRTIHRCPKCK